MLTSLRRAVGLPWLPRPWDRLSPSEVHNIVILGLDPMLPGHHSPLAIHSYLLKLFAASSLLIPLWKSSSYTYHINVCKPTEHIRFYCWEIGGGRPWIADEAAFLTRLDPAALVFLVDAGDEERVIEAFEEYRTAIGRCTQNIPVLLVVACCEVGDDKVASIAERFQPKDARPFRISTVDIDGLKQNRSRIEWSWLVQELKDRYSTERIS